MAKSISAEKEFGNPMRFEFGDNGGEVVFRTFKDAHAWTQIEMNGWRDFSKSLIDYTGQGQAISGLSETIGRYVSPMLELMNLKTTHAQKERRDGIDRTMKLFVDGRLPSQQHPHWQAMNNMIPHAPFIVLGGAVAMLGADAYEFLPSINQEFKSHFLAGFAAAQRPDTAHLAKAEKLRESLDTSTKALAAAKKDLQDAGKHAIKLEGRLVEIKEQQDGYVADQKEEFEQLRASYVGERQLEEPSHHWKTQADLYKGRFEAAVFYLIFVLVCIGLFMVFGAGDLLKTLMTATGGNFQYSHVAILIILAGGVFWLMNVVSKQINHTRIRKADAEFRKTASDTFLALLKDKQRPITDDDKHIILDALFRSPAEDRGGGEGVTPATFLAQILRELRSSK